MLREAECTKIQMGGSPLCTRHLLRGAQPRASERVGSRLESMLPRSSPAQVNHHEV